MNWTYTNTDRAVVVRDLQNGYTESARIDSAEIQEYLAAGGVIAEAPSQPPENT